MSRQNLDQVHIEIPSIKMDNCKTNTSIRRTLSSVPVNNFHCKFPLKAITSNFKDDFYIHGYDFLLLSYVFNVES